MRLTGLIHAHSTYSADSMLSVEDIARFARDRGFDFVALTEHSADLDAASFSQYRTECEQIGREYGVTLIPGLEFDVSENVHILGLGLSEWLSYRGIEELLRAIREEKGLVVVAHLARFDGCLPIEVLRWVDAAEVWNGKPRYDGPWAPRIRHWRTFRRLRGVHAKLRAFAGNDAHRQEQLGRPWMEIFVQGDSPGTPERILEALRSGPGFMCAGRFRLPLCGSLSGLQWLGIAVAGLACDIMFWVYRRMGGRRVAHGLKSLLLGSATP